MSISPALASALSGRYAIEREIGRGGMATVYIAEDLKHQRKVAVKVLLPELAATLGGDRFLQEIRVTANLQHPHILPLYHSGRIGGWTDGRAGGSAVSGASGTTDRPTANPPSSTTTSCPISKASLSATTPLRDEPRFQALLERARVKEQVLVV